MSKINVIQKEAFFYDENFLFKLYNIWVRSLFLENIIFFNLKIKLCFSSQNKKNENCFSNLNEAKSFIKSFLDCLSGISFIECIQGSLETEKNGELYMHAVLGFRFHFNCIIYIHNKLEILLLDYSIGNYELLFLPDIQRVIKTLFSFSNNFDKERVFGYHFMGVYSSLFVEIHQRFISIVIDGCLNYINGKTIFDLFECYSEFNLLPGKFSDIPAVPKRLQNNESYKIIFYLDYFFKKENFILHNSSIYKEENKKHIFILDFEEFLYTKTLFILHEVKKIFDFLNVIELFSSFSQNVEKVVKQFKFLLLNKLNLKNTKSNNLSLKVFIKKKNSLTEK